MMYNYPFFSFPYSRRYYYSYPSTPHTSVAPKGNKNSSESSKEFCKTEFNASSNKSATATSQRSHYGGLSFLDNFFNQQDRDEDESYFDLFGLKLYNDDILLIGLIFFLYKEDVKDQYLFIALILLLLS